MFFKEIKPKRSQYAHSESMLGLVVQCMHTIVGLTSANPKLDNFVTVRLMFNLGGQIGDFSLLGCFGTF